MAVSTEIGAKDRIASLNARIDRLPVWGLSKMVFIVVGLSYFFAFYDISAISFTLPILTKMFHLTTAQTAYPVTANLLGYMIGAYIIGNLADSIGRRKAMMITVVILAIGGLLCAFSWDVWSLTAFRFMTGLGMGAELSLAATVITELSPSRLRGKYMQYNYLWGALGLAVTPFVAVALVSVPGVGWRLVFALGAVVAVMLVFLRGRWLPESPRWLVLNQRESEAEQMIAVMEECCRQAGHLLPEVPDVPAEHRPEGFPTLSLFKKPYLGRMLVTLGFWGVWYITVYAYLGYEPTMLIQMGASTPSGLLYSALGDIAIPIGAVIAYLVVDLIERKTYLALVTVVFAVGLVLMATSHNGVVLFIGTFFSSMMVAANSVGYVYTAESFPTRARATATSIGDGVGHIGGVIAPFIVVASLGSIGARGTFWLLAGIVLVSGLIIYAGGIRTKGESLTEIAS
ncbi:MFS transporter [Alicyclobacillus cycloheptanicus]|uniref:MFS transporter n=1 Tax=Alicyclobacillus cycloheptanicus TaxID=1457 RepID=A0ABT9XGQ0_9BACL|nr:MFS transporter [Alicyclobacillus cycloheptanicus]MDQ0189362.1 putative MFS transporter [Alicyclobacillus cycloheptanicus]WDM01285.1 MFS transporter [Alicyclobacillus cycloheptanicus]